VSPFSITLSVWWRAKHPSSKPDTRVIVDWWVGVVYGGGGQVRFLGDFGGAGAPLPRGPLSVPMDGILGNVV